MIRGTIGFLLVIGTVVLASGMVGCGVSSLPRELCYAQAEMKAQAAVDAQCGEVPFPECPAAEDIVAQLRADQESCP